MYGYPALFSSWLFEITTMVSSHFLFDLVNDVLVLFMLLVAQSFKGLTIFYEWYFFTIDGGGARSSAGGGGGGDRGNFDPIRLQ